MQTHQIHISDGRDRVQEIRSGLFAFPEVLEVFITGRPDVLVIVFAGRPHPGTWLRALRAQGFEPQPRRQAAPALHGLTVAATPGRAPDVTRLRPAA